jgi:hypothetical protein
LQLSLYDISNAHIPRIITDVQSAPPQRQEINARAQWKSYTSISSILEVNHLRHHNKGHMHDRHNRIETMGRGDTTKNKANIIPTSHNLQYTGLTRATHEPSVTLKQASPEPHRNLMQASHKPHASLRQARNKPQTSHTRSSNKPRASLTQAPTQPHTNLTQASR